MIVPLAGKALKRNLCAKTNRLNYNKYWVYYVNKRYFSHESVTNDDVREFKRILSNDKHRILVSNKNEEDSLLDQYNMDWTRHYKGRSNVVLKPKTTEEIENIVSYCCNNKISIVPQGGNTGLVGGSIPVSNKEIIVSLERMNKILSFDKNTGILTCEAGCIIHSLQEYVKEHNYLLPIDLGSKGSCVIGGVVATNAGGQYYYRYGSIHSNLLGLEVVTAKDKSKVLNLLNGNLKNNAGYHLKNVFVGSEGTLGIVTKVTMKCPPYPNSKQCIMLLCKKKDTAVFENVIHIVNAAKKRLNEILAALEYMDMNVMKIVLQSNQDMPHFLSGNDDHFILLLETHGSNSNHDIEKLESFLDYIMESGYIDDAVLSRNDTQSLQM